LDWIGREKEKKIAWAFFTLYNLWSARNDAREHGVIADPVSIVRRSVEGVTKWWNIHHPNKLKSPSVKEHWLYPDVGWLKVNADGAFRDAGKVGGGGVVIRDHHGKFISGACHFFPQVRDAKCAELLACKRALQVALECQVAKIVLETDTVPRSKQS
jgi:hypothetical protein